MRNLNSSPQPIRHRILPDDIFTELDLLHYQHQRLGKNYQGVPGIAIPAFSFTLLDPLLSRLWRINARAFWDVIVVPCDSGVFVTTHIETNCAGDRACTIMSEAAENSLEQEFTENLRSIVLAQHQNHRRWITAGKGCFRLIIANVSQPGLTFREY